MLHANCRFAAVVLWLAAVAGGLSPQAIAAEAEGAGAKGEVKLVLKNFDEIMQWIAAQRGNLIVVDVWSTYCDPCLKEFPGLVALHRKHGSQHVACLSLCVNYSGLGKPEDEIEEPLKFLKAQGATFDNVLSRDPDDQLYKKLKITSAPTILVFGRDGKLLKLFENEVKYSQVEEFIAPLLNAK